MEVSSHIVVTQNSLTIGVSNGQSNSNSSPTTEINLEKELEHLEISSTDNINNLALEESTNNSKNGILSASSSSVSSTSTTPSATKSLKIVLSSPSKNINTVTSLSTNNDITSENMTVTAASSSSSLTTQTATNNTSTLPNKKRISNNSNSRTPTRKAKRIKFYRNGDRFYSGITIPVSYERYRSFESLAEDLTRLLEENVKIPGAVRNIYTLNGKKISNLEELEDGQSYVCSCNNESFKKIDYQSQQQQDKQNKLNRIIKNQRPSSPLKNGTNGSPILNLSERDRIVHPRIVTLIRNGTKPRKIMKLLLNKRNSPSFDHVLSAITEVVKLDTGYVRKVFTFSGQPVTQLADFFGDEKIFYVYGTERVNSNDFELEPDEIAQIAQIQQIQQRSNKKNCTRNKPNRMPKKCNADKNWEIDAIDVLWLNLPGINEQEIPKEILANYTMLKVIGEGNFALVVKCLHKQTQKTTALKIINKSKCKGKEHYIESEVRIMKKINHPHIISLLLDVDQPNYMYLLLEYVGGGDLFDAITRATRFSEDQSRIIIKHLASAMAYLHSMNIVHRDIKPENLLVELDDKGNVLELKLADFGLACEVLAPLTAVCGTPTYVAPEILMDTGYGLKIDVWAAGVILYILLCGFPPFVSPDNEQEPLFDAILSGIYEFPEPYWTDVGDGARDLIANMLQLDPNVRFSSEDILDHYWTLDKTSEYR